MILSTWLFWYMEFSLWFAVFAHVLYGEALDSTGRPRVQKLGWLAVEVTWVLFAVGMAAALVKLHGGWQ